MCSACTIMWTVPSVQCVWGQWEGEGEGRGGGRERGKEEEGGLRKRERSLREREREREDGRVRGIGHYIQSKANVRVGGNMYMNKSRTTTS